MSPCTKSSNTIQNKIGCCGPDEGLWIFVIADDELVDGGDQFIDVFEYAAPNALFSDLGKPALHLIERIRPGNCISPREGGRDILLGCATSLPTQPRLPAGRSLRRIFPVYPRVTPDPSRARCHPDGVSSSIGVKSLNPGRVAR